MDCRDLQKLVAAHGWYLVRQKGSHRQYKHPSIKGVITIPYHISKNIELSVKRQAGIRKPLDKKP